MSNVVVVGASSGLGRLIGIGLAARGARVAFLARREERLRAAAGEAGGDSIAVAVDVTDEASVATAIHRAASDLGSVDGLVYAAGVGHLAALVDTDVTSWREMLDVNVVGASLCTRAALGHLERSGGTAVYLSSVSASLTDPWPGLGAYAASKAALDTMIRAWRVEHPSVGFTRVVVGDTAGGAGDSVTQFADGWGADEADRYMPMWVDLGLMGAELIEPDDLVDAVDLTLGSRADIPSVTVVGRRPS